MVGAKGQYPRSSGLVWQEGEAPDFVMEVAAKSTAEKDAHKKRAIYAAMGVQEYWRFDPTPGASLTGSRLIGERLEDGGYVLIEVGPDQEGYSEGIVQSWDWTSAGGRTKRSGFMTRFAKDGSAISAKLNAGLMNSQQRTGGCGSRCGVCKGERKG